MSNSSRFSRDDTQRENSDFRHFLPLAFASGVLVSLKYLGDQVDLPLRAEPAGPRVQLPGKDALLHLLHAEGSRHAVIREFQQMTSDRCC